MECPIPYKHTLKILYKSNRNIFHRDIKENASGCFFCLNIRQKHPSRFLLYIGVKCLDLYKIFRVCL